MTLSRREFLRMSAWLAAGASLSACAPIYSQLAEVPAFPEDIGAILDDPGTASRGIPETNFSDLARLTFGPRLEDRMAASKIGLQAWIEEQLAPEGLDDSACEIRLRPFETLSMRANDLADLGDKLFDGLDRLSVPDELRQSTLIRQVYSRRQLYEVMAAFWTDHFNISVDKGDCWFLKTVDDRKVIRQHALGNFGDLLWASVHSPAMLVYLDNQANRKEAPNENYARELLELHTLGVDGGYSQQDVMELARCLTGWTVKEHFWRGEFEFRSQFHDDGTKTVLGQVIEPGTQAEAERVIGILSRHPSTAQFISTKLARRFIADDPPKELTQKTASAFLQSGGDIRKTLRTLLLDGLQLTMPKFKPPVRFITSALRMLNAQTDGGHAIQETLENLGQAYFAWPTPDGYPDSSHAWQGNLMPRWRFAVELARGEIPNTNLDLPNLAGACGSLDPKGIFVCLSSLLTGRQLATGRLQILAPVLESVRGDEMESLRTAISVLLASPDFQWY